MGLDIVAYRNLRLMDKGDVAIDEDGEPEDYDSYTRLRLNDHFPAHSEGLVNDGIYFVEGEEYSFRAGSYSGYGAWRNKLAELAGYPNKGGEGEQGYALGAWDSDKGAFHELINFSDCDGCIGPVVAAKLAKDFQDFDDKAKTFAEQLGPMSGFYQVYTDFKIAFEMASENGAVVFC